MVQNLEENITLADEIKTHEKVLLKGKESARAHH
jgi:hypothetical protein